MIGANGGRGARALVREDEVAPRRSPRPWRRREAFASWSAAAPGIDVAATAATLAVPATLRATGATARLVRARGRGALHRGCAAAEQDEQPEERASTVHDGLHGVTSGTSARVAQARDRGGRALRDEHPTERDLGQWLAGPVGVAQLHPVEPGGGVALPRSR